MSLISKAVGAFLHGLFERISFKPGNMILLLLTESDERLTRILRRAIHEARNRRLLIPNGLTIRRTRYFIPALSDNLARVDTDDKCIVLCGRNTAEFSDDDLRVLIGHELGHLVYDRRAEQKSGFVRKICDMEEESFCDAISAYITSPEMFRETSKTRDMDCSLETSYALTRYLEKPARRKTGKPRR